MNIIFQLILIVSSILFMIFILDMIRSKNLELRHALTWIATSFIIIILAIFPRIVKSIAYLLHIIEPANALFLIIIFFVLVIVFTLTVTISKSTDKINTLVQEIGLLKLTIKKLKDENRGEHY
jgi:hypothetical protein